MQRRQEQRQHQSPDRIIEQPSGESVRRPGLAGASCLGTFELCHPQLENPARVLLRCVGTEEHALFAPPVQDRKISLRQQRRRRDDLAPASPRYTVHDAVHQRQHQQRKCQEHEHLLGNRYGVGRRNKHDRSGDERTEQDAQRDVSHRRPAERCDALRQSWMMQMLFRRVVRLRQQLLVGDIDDVVVRRGALAGGGNVADEMCDALFGIGLGGNREFLIVVLAMVRVAQYATGMIDKTKRFFDVALSVASLCVVFSDQTAKRGPHLLIGGTLRHSQRFV